MWNCESEGASPVSFDWRKRLYINTNIFFSAFLQKTHPERQHHIPWQQHGVLQGIQEILLWAVHVCRKRVWCCHHSKHVGAGETICSLVNSLTFCRCLPPHPCLCLQGASIMMEKLPFALRLMISATFKTFQEGPFLTKTVGELMWGYDSKLVDFLNKYLPGQLPSSGKFGLFAEVSS